MVACSAFVISSCDYVNKPLEDAAPVDTSSNGPVQRNVLLEDYTGHKCTACPQAAVIAGNLLQTHGHKLVVVGVHAGFFSTPSTSGTNYLTDFRTSAGNTYNTFFGFAAYPNGLINRKDYSSSGGNAHIKAYGDWAAEVVTELAKPANAKIEITNNYNSTTRALTCNVATTFLHDTLTGGPYKLVVMLTQDSIIATQLDNGNIITNYVHKHVLRDNLNGTWGETISNVPVTKNSPVTKTFNYTLKASYPTGTAGNAESNCDAKHCYIVAFLYNDVTKEVIQVEEKEIE